MQNSLANNEVNPNTNYSTNYVPSYRELEEKKTSVIQIRMNFRGSVITTEETRKLSNPDEVYSGIVKLKKPLWFSEVGPGFLYRNGQILFFVNQEARVTFPFPMRWPYAFPFSFL